MNSTVFFAFLGGLLALAFVTNRLYRLTRVPDVIALMIVGVVLGPVLGWVQAGQFQYITHILGTLALILILFEGGLELSLRDTLRHFPGGVLL
ncbi:MAG: cation:proton antiporter, partial [Terriglobia bacterium]